MVLKKIEVLNYLLKKFCRELPTVLNVRIEALDIDKITRKKMKLSINICTH